MFERDELGIGADAGFSPRIVNIVVLCPYMAPGAQQTFIHHIVLSVLASLQYPSYGCYPQISYFPAPHE